MKFDPTKPLELNMLDRPALPSDFIEETTVTMDPRPGWAPPRRRPRRIFKKLAARDFKARFKPGPRFTGARADIQQRTTRHRAPGLVAWLDNHAREPAGAPPYRVVFLPLMFDGEHPPQLLPHEFRGRDYFITETYDPLPVLAVEDDAKPVVIDRHVTTWTGRRFGKNVMLDSPLATRQIEFYAIVYSPPNVDDRAPSKALEAAAKAVQMAIVAAARGMSYSKIVARQTPYRPTYERPLQ